MTHPSQLELAMYCDDALPEQDGVSVAAHLEACEICRAQVSALRAETGLIANALQEEPAEEARELVVPKFSRGASLRGFALANVATGLVIWLAQFLWKTIFGELAVSATSWITSIYLPDVYEMASATALYLIEEGTAMFDAYLGFIVVFVLSLTVLWFVLASRRSRGSMSVCALVVMCGVMVLPAPASALDVRRDEVSVTVAADEVIDDTLIAAADTVIIEGTVTGDVIAVGRSITIEGSVGGNVVTVADTIKVRGTVGGFALGAGSSYSLDGATIGGDAWLVGEKVSIDGESRVSKNATTAGQSVTVEGSVGKDMYAFSESLELSGELGEDLEAFAARLRLVGDAHVRGNMRYRGPEAGLYRSESARVDGEVEFLEMPAEFERRSPFVTIEFYLWKIAQLIAAFLVGLALVWLAPGIRSWTIGGGVDGVKTAGIGLLAMVSVPIIAVLVAFTLVGLPFTFIAVASWALGLYLANIVVAVILGRMVLSEGSPALSLLVGLLIVVVVTSLPVIGGVIEFLLTIVGLGLLVEALFGALANRSEPEEAAA